MNLPPRAGILAIPLITLVLMSCGVKRHQQTTHARTGNKPSVKVMLQALEDQMGVFNHAKFKAAATIESEVQSGSFSILFKITQDSAIKADAKKGPIPIGRMLITESEYLVIDKLKKCFRRGDTSDIQQTLGVNVDLDWLQNLLMGRPIALDPNQKHFPIKDSLFFGIGTHKRKQFQRAEHFQNDDPEQEVAGDDVLVKYFLDKDSLSLRGMYAYMPAQETEIDIRFLGREFVDGISVPTLTLIDVDSPQGKMTLELRSSRWGIGEPQNMSVPIPENYPFCPDPQPEPQE